MDKEIIGMKPFEALEKGHVKSYPKERRPTVQANIAKVRLKYPDRVYTTTCGPKMIHVIREALRRNR